MKMVRSAAAVFFALLFTLGLFPCAEASDGAPYMGIDVSAWQGNINWSRVKDAGTDFAVIRCYARGKDTFFDSNYAGAKANGIDTGAYVYMYARSQEAAINEACAAIEALGARELELPLYLDVEDESVRSLGKNMLTELILTELSIFEQCGYTAGIYTSRSFFGTYMDAPSLSGYDLWIAEWTCCTSADAPRKFRFESENAATLSRPSCDMWQFSNGGDGAFFGVSSEYVDLDFRYTDYRSSGGRELFSSVSASGISENTAVVTAQLYGLAYPGRCGVYLGTDENSLTQCYAENISGGINKIWYDLREECGFVLLPGTLYYYRFFVELDGTEHLSSAGSFSTAGESPVCRRGDVNGDGTLNSKDVTRLLKYISGEDVYVSGENIDINGDESVDGKDLTALVKLLSE